MQKMARHLSQLQRQLLNSQPAVTIPTFSSNQVCSAPQEFTATSSANELHPIQSAGLVVGIMLGKWEYLFLFILFQLSWKYCYTFKWQQNEWCTTPVIYVRVIATQLVIVNTSSIFSYTRTQGISTHYTPPLFIILNIITFQYFIYPPP